VEFLPNVPVEIALKFATGKPINGQYGERVMFSLVDNRVMFLDLAVALQISTLGVKAGEKFFLKKVWSGRKGEPQDWTAWLSPETELKRAQELARATGDEENALRYQGTIDGRLKAQELAGERGDGTLLVDAPPPIPPARSDSLDGKPVPRPVTRLEDALCTVVAAVHSATKYAKEIGYQCPLFTSEDLRTMANTLMIQQGGQR